MMVGCVLWITILCPSGWNYPSFWLKGECLLGSISYAGSELCAQHHAGCRNLWRSRKLLDKICRCLQRLRLWLNGLFKAPFAFRPSSVSFLIIVNCDFAMFLSSRVNRRELIGIAFIVGLISVIPPAYVCNWSSWVSPTLRELFPGQQRFLCLGETIAFQMKPSLPGSQGEYIVKTGGNFILVFRRRKLWFVEVGKLTETWFWCIASNERADVNFLCVIILNAHQAYIHGKFERWDPGFWHCLKVKT